jgi:poly(hydroxyalkanoate) granule-associated protein
MDSKFKTLAADEDEKLVDAIRSSAQQIWQAGLGAFAIAEAEGGKVFAKLVKEGAEIQNRTRRLAEIKVAGMTDSVSKMADDVGRQASGSWNKIEQVFEDRVSSTLATLGVPTHKEMQALTERVDALSQMLTGLSLRAPAEASPAKRVVKKKKALTTSGKMGARSTSGVKKRAVNASEDVHSGELSAGSAGAQESAVSGVSDASDAPDDSVQAKVARVQAAQAKSLSRSLPRSDEA